jgi:two-component system, OmpR family, sensor histidine kinase TorS
MARARFDRQLRRVFTFISGLTVLVGITAIVSNRYLVETHRALIQNNLPAAALTRQIQADTVYVATLATSFTEVGSEEDLTALTSDLFARSAALNADFNDLVARAPGLETAAPPQFSALEAAVRTQAEAAQDRLAARHAIRVGQSRAARAFAELEDLVARQTDTARVQVTATISDLYDAPFGEIPQKLDQLADVNFFAYDRLYELSRAIEASRVQLEQVDQAPTPEVVETARRAFEDEIATARGRLAYLPSESARLEAAGLIDAIAAMLAPGGVFTGTSDALAAGARLEAELESLRSQTGQLVAYSDALLERMQIEAATSQARTEQLSWWIGFGLIAVLALSIISAALAWRVVSRRTVSRLTDVSRHITALARGDYDREIPETGIDEIGRMERALHILRLRAAEAQRLRHELEDAVTQRTREVVTEMQAHDRARAEAEDANRAKTEFLAMMGHEIRTPLNGVVGMLRLLEDEAPTPAQKKRATLARQNAENLLVLSNDILDYAATQNRHAVLRPVHFDLRELMGQLAAYLRANAEEKGLRPAIDMTPEVPAVLFGDVQKIRQILVNLLSNAVKYTRTGQITLSLDHAPDPASGNPVLSFAVTDTGIGINPADHVRIFDAYSRGAGHPAEAIEGLGLGLSICRRLTEALGGALSLESAPDVGSRFTLTVPLALGDPAKVVRQGEAITAGALNRRVLVVEDQPVNRMVARGYLERLGCTVVEAETGTEGVQRALEGAFDLVLMDIDLPDIDGGEAAGQIRAAIDAPPPIAALTAHRIDDTADQRAALNVDHILYKPLSPRALAALLGSTARDLPGDGPDATRDALASDIADIGADETAAIAAAFLDEIAPALATIQAAQAAADHDALARQAHKLKGAASNFVLTPFCDKLGQIEAAARQGTGVAEQVEGIEAMAGEAVRALRAAARGLGLQLPESSASM